MSNSKGRKRKRKSNINVNEILVSSDVAKCPIDISGATELIENEKDTENIFNNNNNNDYNIIEKEEIIISIIILFESKVIPNID